MKTPIRTWNLTVRLILLALVSGALQKAAAQSGVWTNLTSSGTGSGSWVVATNWQGGAIAGGSGNTADFSQLAITNNSTVTLDGARTIGNLIFGTTEATPTNGWTLATGSSGPLTLAVGAGQPVLTANNGSNVISAVLVNTAVPSGITKTGNGTIYLGAANLITNVINNINAGILELGNNNALGYTNTTTGAVVGTNIVASGATLYVATGVQPVSQRIFIAGAGQGGTNGALAGNAGSGNQQNTRFSFALNSIANPAIVLTGDATIKVDGTGYGTQAGWLVGAITNNTATNSYNLTITGTGELRVDPPVPITVSNIHIASGVLGVNSTGNNGINGTTAVTVDSGGVLACRRNRSVNSGAVNLTLNGVMDLNYNPGAVANTTGNAFSDIVGTLQGNGLITNSYSLAPQLLYVISSTANSVFGGTIGTGTNGPITLRKEGQGSTMWLTGSCAFNGTNVVAGGIQYIDGAWNPTNGGFLVSPQSGATSSILGGNGNTATPIALVSGGFVSAGDPSQGGGTFTISNSISGAGMVFVSNANLKVTGAVGASGNAVAGLYLTNGTLSLPLLATGPSVFASAVTVDGAATISYTCANPTTGDFPLISYGSLGGLAGGGTNGITLVAPPGTTAFLSNNVANSSLDVVVTGIPALVWQGTPSSAWTIGGSANWLNGATASAYTETAGSGPFVVFDDSATGSTTINVSTTVTPSGVTLNNGSKTYTYTGNGSINGSGSVVINGGGSVILANTNTLSGSVAINNGSLTIGGGANSGSVGTASIVNNSQLNFNRSDTVTFANAITGSGALTQNGSGTVTLTGVGNVNSPVTVNAGALALGPSGTITVSGNVTGSGAFGVNGPGKVILSSGTVTYSGGTIISNGTLQLNAAFPPSGNIADYGTLALGAGGTLANNISGPGGLTILNGAAVTLGGTETYTGPTTVLGGGSLTAASANFPVGGELVLGSTNGAADTGSASFTSGNIVVGGLAAGGNSTSPGDPITFGTAGQTLTINGNMYVGNISPSGASIYLPFTAGGAGDSVIVNTNGGLIQIGLGAFSSGVNPDNILVDLSAIDNFIANLGTNGTMNLGTTDGNPGPPAGATVVNQVNLAGVSNAITAGSLNIGAGGRQLVPELRLGAGTNVLNVNALVVGEGGRDGGYLHFLGGSGGLQLRASDGVSRANFEVGFNPATTTGASITNTVDLTGHWVDLLVGNFIIGDYNNGGFYQNTVSFDTGILNAQATSLSVLRNNNANAAASGSTLNINGGTASLGTVSLTASAAFGTLNVNSATLATENITATGSGASTLSIANSPWSLTLTNLGNPATAAVVAQSFSVSGTINLGVNGTNWTVGTFPLIKYTGSIGGTGYPALNLVSLPSGVGGYLSNDVANLAVDMVVTNAPVLVNTNPTNITATVNGSTLSLTWPGDHLGWRLQVQTNALATGLNPASNAWFTVSGSAGVTNEVISINPQNGAVFYRLTYP